MHRRAIPIEPEFVPIRHALGDLDIDETGLRPVVAPPFGRMEAAEIPLPPLFEMHRRLGDLLRKAGADDADAAAGFEEFRDVAEIEIVGAEVLIGIETDDGVEAALRER